MEAASYDDPKVCELLRVMEWPKNLWTRENMSHLSETQFKHAYAFLVKELRGFGCGHNSSLLIELLFNAARKFSRLNPQHKLEPQTMWAHLALADKTSGQCGRPQVPVTSTANEASAGSLPSGLFEVSGDNSTRSKEAIDHLQATKLVWPNNSAENHRASPMLTLTMQRAKGSAEVLKKLWLSLLAAPGTFVSGPGEKHGDIVVSATKWGLLRYNCSYKRVGVTRLLTFDKTRTPPRPLRLHR